MISLRAALGLALAMILTGCTAAKDVESSSARPRVGGAAAPPTTIASGGPTTATATATATTTTHCEAPSPIDGGTSIEIGQVDAETPGLHCCTYLRRHDVKTKASRLAFVQSGTGIYSAANGAISPVATRVLESNGAVVGATNADAALLTMDKPGITSNALGALVFDREAYRQYTLADLVTCGTNALAWGLSRKSVDARASVILHGHSEGAQMMVRMLASSNDGSFNRVKQTILSGLLMESFAAATDRQIAIFMPFEIDAFHNAIEKGDDDYLLQHSLSTKYLTHATAREGMDEVLSQLAKRRPHWRIDEFHGSRDANAPLSLVKDFANKNEREKKAGRPSLDFRLHVYPGARHYLDWRFDADVRELLDARMM